MSNFYEILGVENDADEGQLKKAYRSLSLKYHPDRNSDENAKSKFQEINEAYETLSDASKRQQYDMQQRYGGGGGGGGGAEEFHDINNIFNSLFGGMGGMGGFPQGFPQGFPPGFGGPGIRIFHTGGGPGNFHAEFSINSQKQPPPIIKKEIEITLEQCYAGSSIVTEIERWTIINNSKVNEKESITINIPQGIDESDGLLLKGKGNVINSDLVGDVQITIKILNNTPFKRKGLDLIYNKKISLKEALCGFVIDIPHLNGKIFSLNNSNNPTVVTPGYKKTINGLGMTRDNCTGNLILQLDIEFPSSLTSEQTKALLEIL
jgi:DnaJ-class molecular chaperone